MASPLGSVERDVALAAIEGVELGGVAERVAGQLDARGVVFGAGSGFRVDPIPRVVAGEDWQHIAAGLSQRVAALDHFVQDVYDEQRIVTAGVVPETAIATARHFEPQLAGMPQPSPTAWVVVAGLDLVRDGEGPYVVLEDNTRTPSGMAYAVAAREAVAGEIEVPDGLRVHPVEAVFELLRKALLASAPYDPAHDPPMVVLLTDGPANPAYYEHVTIAARVGIPLVTLDDLTLRRDRRVWVDSVDEPTPVDVIYRRTDQDTLFDADGDHTAFSRLLFEPLASGTVRCVNAFGAGVADDKLLHAYVEEMVRYYLGEEPLLRSVATYDLSREELVEMAIGRADELVFKPRSGHGAGGVVIGPQASEDELSLLRSQLRSEPEQFVAQEVIALSSEPTWCDGRLEQRHVDLRPFAFSIAGETAVFAGGLTRVALQRGSLVVNSSADGGAKDTWVLA